MGDYRSHRRAVPHLVQVQTLGGRWDSIIAAGETSLLGPWIQSELPDVTLLDGPGHDGQMSFAIARDPLGDRAPLDAFDHPGYRYRRILYSALAGLANSGGPDATVAALIVVSLLGFGIATAAAADIGTIVTGSPWPVAGVLANPGLWISLQISTSDSLAMGLALTALSLILRSRIGFAAIALALSALAKDQYLLFAVGIGWWLWSRDKKVSAVALLGAAAAPLASWAAFVSTRMSDGYAVRGNLSGPFLGIVRSSVRWIDTGGKDLIFSFIILAIVVASIYLSFRLRRGLTGKLLIVWTAMAALSSTWVWDFGNNSLRVFSPLIFLVALGTTEVIRRTDRRSVAL